MKLFNAVKREISDSTKELIAQKDNQIKMLSIQLEAANERADRLEKQLNEERNQWMEILKADRMVANRTND